MSGTIRTARAQGELRQSQVVTTFGPGAMVDLPDHAILVSGLDDWSDNGRRPISEARLTARIDLLLETKGVRLFAPPVDPPQTQTPGAGIDGWLFPEWFVAQFEERRGENSRRRPLIKRRNLVRGCYLGPDRKRYPVVPVRFVQACINGHLSDIHWAGFVHSDLASKCSRSLWLEERGTSGDLADVVVQCECGASRPLSTAAKLEGAPLGFCNGDRPWLGRDGREKDGCGGGVAPRQPNRLLTRSASNAYFAETMRVISIPDQDAALRAAVDQVWEDNLQHMESLADLVKERKRPAVKNALEGLSDDRVWAEIRRRLDGTPPPEKNLKQVEIETFLSSQTELGTDAPEGDFHARTIAPSNASVRPERQPLIERLVLVHRLREVTAQVGFTRFEAATPDVDGELSLDVRRGALARETTWVPAVESRGEGFFIGFRKDAIRSWLGRPNVKRRGEDLLQGFLAWKSEHADSKAEFPSLPYLLLHSLSHLLITSVSLACGYSASSIRERIYAGDAGYGILLYTGTTDAEGTLGGLIQVGRSFGQHLERALELGRLCSNDPVCAQHAPQSAEERRFLHGAACHGCVLIAETSCERRNEMLDRALVVGTVDGAGAEFFEELA